MKYRRIFTIVIDSFGIGAMDNAAEYGDTGCDTFGHIADKIPEIKIPHLIHMGLTASSSPCFDKSTAVRPHWKICEIK